MRATYPALSGKLSSYVAAPLPARRLTALEIRTNRFAEERSPSRLRFLWIGRWTAHKGTEALLRWIGASNDETRKWSLTIAGCGMLTDRKVVELVSRGVITIVPEFDSGEWSRLLRDHDAGLFTSRVEGWGLSLQEMLECGLPVFATQAGAAADLGNFFPTQLRRFPPDLVTGRVSLLPDPLNPGYLRRFDWSRIASEYLYQVERTGHSR